MQNLRKQMLYMQNWQKNRYKGKIGKKTIRNSASSRGRKCIVCPSQGACHIPQARCHIYSWIYFWVALLQIYIIVNFKNFLFSSSWSVFRGQRSLTNHVFSSFLESYRFEANSSRLFWGDSGFKASEIWDETKYFGNNQVFHCLWIRCPLRTVSKCTVSLKSITLRNLVFHCLWIRWPPQNSLEC